MRFPDMVWLLPAHATDLLPYFVAEMKELAEAAQVWAWSEERRTTTMSRILYASTNTDACGSNMDHILAGR